MSYKATFPEFSQKEEGQRLFYNLAYCKTTDHRQTTDHEQTITDPPAGLPPTHQLPTNDTPTSAPPTHRLTDRSSTDPPITNSPILLKMANNPLTHWLTNLILTAIGPILSITNCNSSFKMGTIYYQIRKIIYKMIDKKERW